MKRNLPPPSSQSKNSSQGGTFASGSGTKYSNSNLLKSNGESTLPLNGGSGTSISSQGKGEGVDRRTRSVSRGLNDSPKLPSQPLEELNEQQESEEEAGDSNFFGIGNGIGRKLPTKLKSHPARASFNGLSRTGSDTSVNIASAFKQAILPTTATTFGSNKNLANFKSISSEEMRNRKLEMEKEREKDQMEEEEMEEESQSESGKDTQQIITNSGTKRKKAIPTSSPPRDLESEDEVLLQGTMRGTAKKAIMEPEPSKRKPLSRANSIPLRKQDKTYKPDLTLSDSSSSDSAPKKRSKSRASSALEISKSAGIVWGYGNKKKKRKGRSSNDSIENQNEMEQDESMDQSRIEEDDGDESLFPNLPPPKQIQKDYVVESIENEQTNSLNSSVEPIGYYLARPPLIDTPRPPGALPRQPLTQSPPETRRSNQLSQSNQSNINQSSRLSRRSESLDESGVRGESYDYSEEERIVLALEKIQFEKNQNFNNNNNDGKGKEKELIHANALRRRIAGPPTREFSTPNRGGRILREIEEEIDLGEKKRELNRIRLVGLGFGLLTFFYLFYTGIKYYRASPSKSESYQAPSIPADSFEAIVTRLTSVESTLESLSSSSISDRSLAEKELKRFELLNGLVIDLESNLEQVERRIEIISDETELSRQSDLELVVKLEKELRNTRSKVDSMDQKLEKAVKSVHSLEQNEKLLNKMMEAIQKRLPDKIAIKFNSKGQVELDPTFWRYLQSAFIDKSQLSKLTKSDDHKAQEGLDWNSFLEKNSEALEIFIQSNLKSQIQSNAILSKKSFTELLRIEIKKLKIEFELATNENLEEIGRELLQKVAKQDELRFKSQSNPIAPPPTTITYSTPDGINITSLIKKVVDSALLKYSKDILAKPDYAAYSSGARIFPSLTSQTYSIQPKGFQNKLLGLISRNSISIGKPASTALESNINLGSCWPFKGQEGQIGILLSRKIHVEEIILQHISLDLSLDGHLKSAPKEFELWGVVESEEEIELLSNYREERMRRLVEGEELERDEEQDASLPSSNNHLLLAKGIYNISLEETIQTFKITKMAKDLNLSSGVVILKVLSNWGEEDYTCIYRIRIGGQLVHV